MTELNPAVAAVVDAINDGDEEAFVAAFTDDGQVDDWGRVLPGPDGARSCARTDAIGMGARMGVLEATERDDVTELRFTWSSRRFNGESRAFVTVRDGKVSEFRIPAH